MMKEFDVDKERWENELFQKFQNEDIEFMVGTNHTNKNRVRVMVEQQHASKAHKIILQRSDE